MRRATRIALVGGLASALLLTGASCDLGGGTAVAKAFEGAKQDPVLLRAFLNDFPKGGDLENQLVGSVYAEDLIEIAAGDRMCFDESTLALTPGPCAPGQTPVARALTDRTFSDRVVDAISLRHFTPAQNPSIDSTYSQYYATFPRFTAVANRNFADLLASAKSVAALNNVQYVEYQVAPLADQAAALSTYFRGPVTAAAVSRAERRGLDQLTRRVSATLARADEQYRVDSRCGTTRADPSCAVQARFLYRVDRAQSFPVVAAQLALGFSLARTDSRFVGVSLAGVESAPSALRDYQRQLSAIESLERTGTPVPVTVQAGQLAQGLVPPSVLGTHIQLALEAGARRISSGADIGFSPDVHAVLNDLRQQQVAVASLLTTDQQILGQTETDQPFQTYQRAAVPQVVATSNQAVSRDDLTSQFQRVVEDFDLNYSELLTLSRQSLESSFAPGRSLWTSGVASSITPVCASDAIRPAPATAGASTSDTGIALTAECAAYISTSPRAQLQLQLERELTAFADAAPNIFTERPPTSTPSR